MVPILQWSHYSNTSTATGTAGALISRRQEATLALELCVALPHVLWHGGAYLDVVPLVVPDGLIDESDRLGKAGAAAPPLPRRQVPAADAHPPGRDGEVEPTRLPSGLLVGLGRLEVLDVLPNEANEGGQVPLVVGLGEQPTAAASSSGAIHGCTI